MFWNDNEATNEIAGEMFAFIANEIESYRSKFGTMTPGILPVSGNTPFGLEVGALPSGRHTWKPLADGVSPKRYGKDMTVEEVVKEICKDEIFFFHSGGDVTISEGEVLMQADFAKEILISCMEQRIPTAIETSLYSSYDITD